ncbi:MAG: hotdog fold thioesterase [Ginsengibacter sp.]
MSIWFNKSLSLSDVKDFGRETMAHFLNIKWVDIGDDFIKMSIPVDERTRQPYGMLHGGASCVLAETIGSLGSALVIDMNKFYCVGLEINANHIRSAKSGLVTATCIPLHLGKSTHVWDIKLHDDLQKLTCACRLTVAIIPIKKQNNEVADS